MQTDYAEIITVEPGKRGGKPCIRGLRITVYDVLEYLASGMTEPEILADFPDLTREDIRACLAFAAERERRLVSIPVRMRLLFDQNLSWRLREALQDLYPQSLHVRDVGLASATDATVWAYAKEHALVIVSKDADFRHLGFTYGQPPKIIWIRRGNCSTREIEVLLRKHRDSVLTFHEDEQEVVLVLV